MKIQSIEGILGSNTFLVENKETVILIDAGAPLEAVALKLNGRMPNAILLTHEHFDHVFYIADYCREFECPIYCHSQVIAELKTNKLGSRLGFHDGFVKSPKDYKNFFPIEKNTTFSVDALEIKALHCSGHSACSICYLFNDLLFTGDVLFANTIGRTDLMPNGNELMQTTLKNLQKIKFDTAYHGHSRNSSYDIQQKNIAKHINN